MICKDLHLKDYYDFLGEDGKDARLTVFLQTNLTEMNRNEQERPCILVCPGGGYAFCSQREGEPIAVNFLDEGYNVFVLNYSVAPHKFPSAILEVAAVVDLIHKNKAEWHCDVNRIAIMGFSAGGHLAGHYSNCFDCEEVRKYFPESHPVAASVLGYPVITAKPEIAHLGSFQNLLGKTELTEDEILRYSLNECVSDKTPPAFIWHTAEDTCVPVENSLLYAMALTKHKIPYELHIYPFGPHGLSTADYQTCDRVEENIQIANSWIADVKKWLHLILKTNKFIG